MTKFMVTALIAGTILGLAMAGIDLLNPHTAAAEADRIGVETAHQQAVYQLQEQRETAKTEAQIREIERQQTLLDAQYQHDIQVLSQNLAHREMGFKIWMAVIAMLGGAIAATVFVGSTILIGSRALVYVRSSASNEKPIEERPMTNRVPPPETKVPIRESYDPLGATAILYEKRINERLQEISQQEEKELDDEALLEARMRAAVNPARMSSQEYRKRPRV
jgi:hypothetical protein